MKIIARCVIIAAFLALAGCGPDPRRQAEMAAVNQLSSAGKISQVEAYRRRYAIEARYRGLDPYDHAYWRTVIAAAERYDRRQITWDQLLALDAEAWALNIQRTNADLARNRSVSCYQYGSYITCD